MHTGTLYAWTMCASVVGRLNYPQFNTDAIYWYVMREHKLHPHWQCRYKYRRTTAYAIIVIIIMTARAVIVMIVMITTTNVRYLCVFNMHVWIWICFFRYILLPYLSLYVMIICILADGNASVIAFAFTWMPFYGKVRQLLVLCTSAWIELCIIQTM